MMRDQRKFNALCPYLAIFIQTIFLVLAFNDQVTGAVPPNNVPHFRRRDEQPQRLPSKYKYSYNVQGIEGDQHGHQVSQNGPYSSGKYYVKLNQGTSQNVEYYTDHLGYHPKVVYSSQLDSGRSGARVILGANANNYRTSDKADSKLASSEHTSTEVSSTFKDSDSTTINSNIPQTVPYHSLGSINPQFGLKLFEDGFIRNNENATINYSALPQNVSAETTVNGTILTPIPPANLNPLLQHINIPTDAYLQPEFNEITNSFLGKIVSVVPNIKFLRPIIVTDSSVQNQSVNVTNIDDIKPDQSVESAQPQEYHDITPYAQLVLAGVSVINPKNETIAESPKEITNEEIPKLDQESEKSKTIVDIEPQMVEEQAVITTTVDISKSLPLEMNYIPDIDNHLNELKQNSNYATKGTILEQNSIPAINYPIKEIIPHSQSLQTIPNYQINGIPAMVNHIPPINYISPSQQDQYLSNILTQPHMLYNMPHFMQFQLPQNIQSAPFPSFGLPQNPSPPLPNFQYVPIPILQHQPNVIPLNYVDNAQNQVNTGPLPTNWPIPIDTLNQSLPTITPLSEEVNQQSQDNIAKRENHVGSHANAIISNFPSKPIKPSFIDPLINSHQPYAYQVPAAQLIPYVKQITNSPNVLRSNPYTQHIFQQQHLGQNPARAHSVSYNVRLFPKDHQKPLIKPAPFKPSHPVWDSIYPPQHMYYMPYYVVDKIPNDRKARDSTYRRNQRRVRRLFVEYGGFKPPMIPSTLLEIEETNDKPDVPKSEED